MTAGRAKLRTVLGIPGTWADRTEIVQAIEEKSEGYLFAGGILLHRETNEGFDLEVYDADPHLREAFQVAGRGSIDDATIEKIARHNFTLYIVAEGGTTERATELLHAAHGLLKAGGLAVKVESAGIAHSREDWSGCCASPTLGDLLHAYVTYVGADGKFYSCGMHNLGHPDALIDADITPDKAAELLHQFVGYLLVETPELEDGHTFSLDETSASYQLEHAPCTEYDAGDLFHNPFGIWRITPKTRGKRGS